MRGTDGGCVMKRVRKAFCLKPFVGSVPGTEPEGIFGACPRKRADSCGISRVCPRKEPSEIPILKATRQKCYRCVGGCFAHRRFVV